MFTKGSQLDHSIYFVHSCNSTRMVDSEPTHGHTYNVPTGSKMGAGSLGRGEDKGLQFKWTERDQVDWTVGGGRGSGFKGVNGKMAKGECRDREWRKRWNNAQKLVESKRGWWVYITGRE